MKTWIKHALVLVGFVLATMIFFSPKFDGKSLKQGDIQKWEGMIKEQKDYYEKEGGQSVWCSSMFSGMPAYTIGNPSSLKRGTWLLSSFFEVYGQRDAGIIVCMLFCMYALLISLGCSIVVSVFGAIAFAFSSYSLIIIAAGHVSKGWTMAYMPLTLCGMQLIMNKKKYLLGGVVFTLGFTLIVNAGHYQILYYFVILAFMLFVFWMINKIMKKDYTSLLRSFGVLAIGCFFGVMCSASALYSHLELGKTSIRGKSDLTSQVDGKQQTKSSGLDRDYAFAWSYGIGETMTVLIPNFMGGESGGELDRKESNLAQAFTKNGYRKPQKLETYTYWGDQPFTSGPVYFGAIVCFLTLLALLYVRDKWTWMIFGASLFFFVLSFGHNMAINNFFFDYLPFYNKFRTPSMALVIPQFTFAILAALVLKKYVDVQPNKEFTTHLCVATGVTAGLCLIFWLAPSICSSMGINFESANDSQYGLPDWYMNALIEDRKDLLSSDAFRSMMFILLAAGLLWVFSKESLAKYKQYVAIAVAVLTFVDLWQVDKRYLNDDNFEKDRFFKSMVKPSVADNSILKDKDLDYRVLTLNNPFNDTRVSYFHHSIGGYNAAKLRRYQDLIEQKIESEIMYIKSSLSNARSENDVENVFAGTPVLNMLNMKYLIVDENKPALVNKYANGPAWFVSSIVEAKTADEEMQLLKTQDTKQVAIVSSEQMNLVSGTALPTDGTIELVHSKPNTKTFKTTTSADAVAVFSDVYYQPGWTATIDGKEVEHVRANWTLRAIKVPAGSHEICFTFYPQPFNALRYTEIALTWVLVLVVFGLAGWYYYYPQPKKGKKDVVANA